MTTDVPEGPREGQATGPRFVRLLRLVQPLPPLPSEPPRKRGYRGPPVFSAEEQVCLRASLRTGRHVLGTWKALAKAMHVTPDAIKSIAQGKGRPMSAEIAVRLSKVLGLPLESLCKPGLRPVRDPCPTCTNPGDGAA